MFSLNIIANVRRLIVSTIFGLHAKWYNILSVIKNKDRVVVEGVNIVKHHRKATQENPGKIEEKEASIHISNVSHLDPDTGKPTRVKYEVKDGVKKRVSVTSGSLLDK